MLLLFCGGGGIDTFLSNLSITNESVSLVVVVILELRYIGGVLVYASIGLRTHHPTIHKSRVSTMEWVPVTEHSFPQARRFVDLSNRLWEDPNNDRTGYKIGHPTGIGNRTGGWHWNRYSSRHNNKPTTRQKPTYIYTLVIYRRDITSNDHVLQRSWCYQWNEYQYERQCTE